MSSNTSSNQSGGVIDNLSKAASDAATTVGNAANSTANYLTGRTEEVQKEAGKETVKSDSTTAGQKIDGAKAYVTHGLNQAEADTKKEYYDKK